MRYPLPYATNDLTGQVAIVTGASSGLGLRFARVLAACGAKVALAARRIDKLEDIAAEIRAGGGQAVAIPMDALEADQLTNAVAQAEDRLGPLNILVNNAGIPDAMRAHKMPVDLIDKVIGTNLRAPYILSCEFARRLLRDKRPGRIVNIASSAAFDYSGNGSALYSITKSAVVRMTEALSVEWAPFNINVNAIAPGAFSTEMLDGMIERIGDFSDHLPRKRLCDPALLDSTLLYLVSLASEAVTGTCIRVDDGQHRR